MSFELFGTPLYSPTIKSRAITGENPKGEVGAGGKELNGRKGKPCHWKFKKGERFVIADIEGPGAIRHIWITVENKKPVALRNMILRFYWDGQENPSVEAPLTDFFGVCHGGMRHFESVYLTMTEGKGLNSYFLMPFEKRALLTITNEADEDAGMFFYQVDYTVGDEVTGDTPRFHAQFRRVPKTTLREDYVILDGVKGKGRFLGSNIGIVDRYAGTKSWWGEGEVKMYLDGDTDYPTICGTGAEDYACSAWGLGQFHCREFGSPLNESPHISFYRFHGHDPVYFSQDIKVTIQQLGNDGSLDALELGDRPAMDPFIEAGEYEKPWKGGNYERVDDVCSTAYWYQTLPTQPFPELPSKDIRSASLPEAKEHRKSAAEGPQAQQD